MTTSVGAYVDIKEIKTTSFSFGQQRKGHQLHTPKSSKGDKDIVQMRDEKKRVADASEGWKKMRLTFILVGGTEPRGVPLK